MLYLFIILIYLTIGLGIFNLIVNRDATFATWFNLTTMVSLWPLWLVHVNLGWLLR